MIHLFCMHVGSRSAQVVEEEDAKAAFEIHDYRNYRRRNWFTRSGKDGSRLRRELGTMGTIVAAQPRSDSEPQERNPCLIRGCA